MSENLKFWWRRNRHGSPSWALQLGPLRLLWWRRDQPQWFVRPGRLYLAAAMLGRLELLFWDRGLC